MSALAQWLMTGVVHGTLFFGAVWVVSATLLRRAHPASRSLLFLLVLLKFAVPFGPELTLPVAGAPQSASVLTGRVLVAAIGERASSSADWLAASWVVVVVVLATVRVAHHLRLRRALRVLAAPADVLGRVAELARRVGVRAPRTGMSSRGPCLVGVWRPVLLLPPGTNGTERDAMVTHELAHLRRGDPFVRLVQAVVETLFFFWPVVRLASRHLELAREQACDLAVAETGVITHTRYAELLLKLVLESSPTLAMAAQPTHLERRIDMVLNETNDNKPRRWPVIALLAVAGVVASGASLAAPSTAVLSPRARPATLKVDEPLKVDGPLKIDGLLDARVVQTVIAMNMNQVTACYDESLALHPATEGQLVLHWDVKDDGSVTETCQSLGTTVAAELGRCVSERVMTWQFPSPGFGQRASVEYTFDFTRLKQQR